MQFTVLAVVSGLAALAQAFTQPTTQLIDGNPIFTPTNGEKVPVGKPFGVTWKPTTNGTVTILLISGATQGTLSPLYPIVETTPNSGAFSWTPKTDLPEGKVYGLQLIDDATGQFQYSMPFAISNAAGASGSVVVPSSTAAGNTTAPVSTPAPTSSAGSASNSSSTIRSGNLTITTSVSSTGGVTTPRPATTSSAARSTPATASGNNADTVHQVGGALGLLAGVVAFLAL